MKRLLPLLAVLACNPTVSDDVPLPEPVSAELLREQAVRVSMALRGHRPSLAELDAVSADPEALGALADDWMDDPRFGETVRHMHADTLLTRATRSVLPAVGDLRDEDQLDIANSIREEPLALIEHVVMNDRPYTEIVTADYTVVDAMNPRIFANIEREDGPGDQLARHTDGRPAAGILATNGLWMRFQSAGQNYQRQRANAIGDALLCSDFVSRDIPITGEIDLSDPDAVADALNSQPECVACHQTLDPLATHLFTIRSRLIPNQVIQSYANDCGRGAVCYPVPMYAPNGANAWRRLGLRPPGYYGQPSEDLGTLGQHIAGDPRFAQCTVRRFVSYLTQTPADELSLDRLAPLQERFEASDFDARDLVRAIVLDPDFTDPGAESGVGLLAARPVQLAATIEDLTGFRMIVNVDGERCIRNGTNCFGDIDMVYDDAIGFRAMAGGIDGVQVTRPTWTTTPTKALFLAALAEESAGHVVDADFATGAGERRLLGEVEADTTDEAKVRDQLVALHLRLYGTEVEADDAQIDEAYDLFTAALGRRTGPDAVSGAWKLTLAGLLQDPRLLLY